MLFDTQKIDTTFSKGSCRPENRDEYERMCREYPPDLPATHAWGYEWTSVTPEELKKNRYIMPVLHFGPRELTLEEIGAKTKDFATLKHAELRYLFDKHKMKAAPTPKDGKAPDETEGLRAAVRIHSKTAPAAIPKGVTATSPAKTDDAVVLPDDVAGMDSATIETQVTVLGLDSAGWTKIARKPLPVQRQWFATERAKAKQTEPAMA